MKLSVKVDQDIHLLVNSRVAFAEAPKVRIGEEMGRHFVQVLLNGNPIVGGQESFLHQILIQTQETAAGATCLILLLGEDPGRFGAIAGLLLNDTGSTIGELPTCLLYTSDAADE